MEAAPWLPQPSRGMWPDLTGCARRADITAVRSCDRQPIPVRHTGRVVGKLVSLPIGFSGPAYRVPMGWLPRVSVRPQLWKDEPVSRCVSHIEGL